MPAGAGQARAARDYLAVAPAVVQVACDVPLPRTTACCPGADGSHDARPLSERWGLDSPLNRVLAALRANDRSKASARPARRTVCRGHPS